MSEKQDTTVVMSVRLTPEQHEELRKLSFDTRISQAEHIRKAIDAYLLTLKKEG